MTIARRLWVTQEVFLAPSNFCLCGPALASLIDILRVSAWLGFRYESLVYVNGDVPSFKDERLKKWWLALEPCVRISPFTRNFGDILEYAQARELTREHDRIYGLLGLLEGDIPDALKPNYSRPVIDVLCDGMRYGFIHDGLLNLDLLRRIDHRTAAELESDERPSWIPRWERQLDSNGASDFILEFRADGGSQRGYEWASGERSAFLAAPDTRKVREFLSAIRTASWRWLYCLGSAVGALLML